MKKFLINKFSNTKIFVSISSNPGIVGTVFYNNIFEKLKLNMIYRAIRPTNLKKFFISLKEVGINGCSVSMPFKDKVIKYLDKVDPVCIKTNAVNTIVNNNGKLLGYNCDFLAIKKIFQIYKINKNHKLLIFGTGSVARILIYLLKKNRFNNFRIIGRNLTKIKKIEKEYNFKNKNYDKYDILINASPLGMRGFEQKIPFTKKIICDSILVIDYVNKPANTKLIKFAKKNKINFCTGLEISARQLSYQFKLYTGIKLHSKYFDSLN
jgi:shikimate dehydrogenase